MNNPTNVTVGKASTNKWKVSPTQVKAWMECPRKWGYRYIDGIETPQTKSAALGSATHSVLERYFAKGTDPDTSTREGKLAAAALQDGGFPGPATLDASRDERMEGDLLVEAELNFEWDGVHYRGFMDLGWWGADDHPTVSDHKTSSDPAKYGLTADQLLTDAQGLIYGVFGMAYWSSDACGLQWTYIKTKGRAQVIPVRNLLKRTEAHKNFADIVAPVGAAIYDALKNVDEAKNLAANPSACGMYGGCPHAEYCPRTRDEKITAIFGQDQNENEQGKGKSTMGIKDMLKAKGRDGKRKAPPRPEELKNKDKDKGGDVVPMPGRTVNAPEAPANAAVAREVSQAVGAAEGSKAQKKAEAKSVANAAAGATTAEEARDAIANRVIEPNITWFENGQMPKDWDPSATPKPDQVLAWVVTGTFHDFTSDRKAATAELPFAHGRTLSSLDRAGKLSSNKTGSKYRVLRREGVVDHFRKLDDPSVWAQRKPKTEFATAPEEAPEPEAAATPEPEHVPNIDTMDVPSGLVVAGRIVDGKLALEVDLDFLKGLVSR